VVDLAFRDDTPDFAGWTVVDFKTELEFEEPSDRYIAQIRAYGSGSKCSRTARPPSTRSRSVGCPASSSPGGNFGPMRSRGRGKGVQSKARAWCIGTRYVDEHADVEKTRRSRLTSRAALEVWSHRVSWA
jgi:hypothetical protein